MKHTTKLFLSSLLCVVLHTVAGAQVPGNVLPAVERAATQAAQRAAAQTARTIVPNAGTNTISEAVHAATAPVPRVTIATQPNLLTLSNTRKALELSTQRSLKWQKLGLLPEHQSFELGTALVTNRALQTAQRHTPREYASNLEIIQEHMGKYPLVRKPVSFSLRPQDFYPQETAQGLFPSQNDFIKHFMDNNNQLYTYLAAEHLPALRRSIMAHLEEFRQEANAMVRPEAGKEFIWAAQQVPVDTDILFLGEEHVDWIPEQMIPMIDVLQERMKGREIIFLTEFLPKGHVLNLEKDGSLLEKVRDPYLPLWSVLEEKNILVIGLDFMDGSLKKGASFYEGKFLVGETDPQMSKSVWTTLEGLRVRNQHWLEEIQTQRAAHPDALFVVHAGYGHTSYIYPFSVVQEISGKNYVVEMIDGRNIDEFDALIAPHEMPDILKWSNPELGRAAGFDLRIKLDRKNFYR